MYTCMCIHVYIILAADKFVDNCVARGGAGRGGHVLPYPLPASAVQYGTSAESGTYP